MTSNTPTADQAMEYKIQEAGLNAPRLTPVHIDSVINSYTSWSPKDTFEKAYMPTNGISLGLAIDAMKLGLSVRLPYWSEDVFLSLQKPTDLSKMTAPYIYVTSRFGLVPWVATQVELLSTEWEIINA